MYEEPISCEEGPITQRKTRTLQSGMKRTGSTLIKKRIPGPHEGLYSADGKRGTYGHNTHTEFVQGYLSILNMELDTRTKGLMSNHLDHLMDD